MRGQSPTPRPVQVVYDFRRQDDKADLGGMEAALDDALQGIVIVNDKQIVSRRSTKCTDADQACVLAWIHPL